jgi:hypothetical protein
MLQPSRERILEQAALSGSVAISRRAELLPVHDNFQSIRCGQRWKVAGVHELQFCSYRKASKPRPDSTSRQIRVTHFVGELHGLGNGFQPQQSNICLYSGWIAK